MFIISSLGKKIKILLYSNLFYSNVFYLNDVTPSRRVFFQQTPYPADPHPYPRREAESEAEEGLERRKYSTVNTQTLISHLFTFNTNQDACPLANEGPASLSGRDAVWLCLVREKAGKGLSEVANGLCLCLFLTLAPRACDSAEERGVAEGTEGIGQGLGLTGNGEERKNMKSGNHDQKILCVNMKIVSKTLE